MKQRERIVSRKGAKTQKGLDELWQAIGNVPDSFLGGFRAKIHQQARSKINKTQVSEDLFSMERRKPLN